MDAARVMPHTFLMDRTAALAQPASPPLGIELFAMVRLTEAVRGIDRQWPAGSVGAVVEIYKDGEAYEVEFSAPSDVATVYAGQLTRV